MDSQGVSGELNASNSLTSTLSLSSWPLQPVELGSMNSGVNALSLPFRFPLGESFLDWLRLLPVRTVVDW